MRGSSSHLLDGMLAAGGVMADYHGTTLIRHFGDPHAEYVAATEGVAVFDRSHRTRMVVSGRSPGQMLNGILTGAMPGPPEPVGEGVLRGAATYHAVLTPKGKMITDLWCLLRGEEEVDGFLLDVPVAGAAGLTGHLARFLPPRLAKLDDVTETISAISVAGVIG